MSVRFGPMAESVRRWGGWPLILGAALGLGMAAAPPKSFAERIGPIRPGPGRLVGFAYAPEGWEPSLDQRKVLRNETVRLDLELATPGNRNTERLWQRATLALVGSNPELAVELLEESLSSLPPNVSPRQAGSLHSDLSVAHLSVATKNGSALERIRALDEAAKASLLAPKLSEAHFNLLMMQRAVSLDSASREESARYLRSDPASAWTQELAEADSRASSVVPGAEWLVSRRQLLEATHGADLKLVFGIVHRFPQEVRTWIEDEGLPDWARQSLAGNAVTSMRDLDDLRVLGEALRSTTGDRLILDSVSAIDAKVHAQDFASMLRGLIAYGDGKRLYGEGSIVEASSRFSDSFALLGAASNPFAAWARFQVGVCKIRQSQWDDALAELLPLTAPDHSGYPILQARAWWNIGLIRSSLGGRYDGLRCYFEARQRFERSGELGNLAAVDNLIAEGHRHLGDFQEASKFHLAALALLPKVPDQNRRRLILDSAAATAREAGSLVAANVFEQASSRLIASGSGWQPESIAQSIRRRSETWALLGKPKQALNDLTAGWSYVHRIQDTSTRANVTADFEASRSRIAEDEVGRRARDRAIASYEALGIRAPLIGLLLDRSREPGRSPTSDLLQAAHEIEADLRSPTESSLKEGFLRLAAEVFDDLTLSALRQGDREAAFGFSEQAPQWRRRVLRAALKIDPEPEPTPPQLVEVGLKLPPKTTLIKFAVLEDRCSVWILRRDAEPQMLVLPASRPRLSPVIAALQESAVDSKEPDPVALETLFDFLIRPVLARLEGAETLVIVPDGTLASVPFAALRAVETGHYLIEDYAIQIAPGATILADRLSLSPLGQPENSRVVVVGDPTFDTRLFPSLPPLRFAREEGRGVGQFYPGSTILLGVDATEKRVLSVLQGARMFHFSGHSLWRSSAVLDSGLVLAQEPSGTSNADGILTLRDMAGFPLSQLDLVVLSACHVADSDRIGGIGSFAEALLALGARAVMGSLWPIDDRATQPLLAGFYRHLHRGETAVDALRGAQLTMISTPSSSPRDWAGLALYSDTPCVRGRAS